MNGSMAKQPSSRSVMTRHLAFGIIVGCGITSLPWLGSKLNSETLWPLNFLDLPGLIASIALTGNAHDYSMSMALAVNVIFYGSLTYLFLRIRKKRDYAEPQPPDVAK